MIFSDTFFKSLNDWQNGWRENQETKNELASILEGECENLPAKYKEGNQTCYRKRFLHKGEMVDILMNNNKDEGITSWTSDIRFAERFKNLYREDAVTAAIFEHTATASEVILNISALWNCKIFHEEFEKFQEKEPESCTAISNFKNLQSEIVLKTPLRGSEIIALTGFASPFDELCERLNVPEESRDELYYKMIDEETYPLGVTYIKEENAKRAVQKTIMKFIEKINEMKPY